MQNFQSDPGCVPPDGNSKSVDVIDPALWYRMDRNGFTIVSKYEKKKKPPSMG